MADVRARASNNASGDKGRASSRLRVMRTDVQEVLRIPPRSRPKKQQPPSPSPSRHPPLPPPPREEEKEDQFELARYNCAFQNECEGTRDFLPPDLVWGKVRSHPWWPGQVFDPADASEVALQHRRAGAPLVAYFWDRTFAWNDASALLPFRVNFTRFSAQSTMSGFVSAIDAALQEVGRRVEAGLSCGCFSSTIATKQEVENSGIRQGAYGAVVDRAYMRDAFSGKAFLDYISTLGKRPLAGADLLDLATAKAQLKAFNRSRGPRGLPEFVVFEGIEDVTDAILHTKRKRMHKSNENGVLRKEKKSKCARNSSSRNEALPDVANEDVPSREAADEDTVSKGNKSKGTKSSPKKRTGMSKHSDGLETAAAGGGSRTPANNARDNILSENKSVRTLRSTSKKDDALEGLKMLGKGRDGQTLTENSKDAPLLKENKLRHTVSAAHKKDKISEDENGLGDGSSSKDSASTGKRSSGCKRLLISEHGRKKKKLSELMEETAWANSTPYHKHKTRGTPSLHVSAVKAEDSDRDSKDTVATRKRKKLSTLGDLSSRSQPLSHKKSTRVGELMTKASGHTSVTPPAVKANGRASQTKLHSAKHKRMHAANKSPRHVKANQGKKRATIEEPLSCGEMLWQLALAACDLKHGERITPTSVNFFTGFRKNSNVSSCDVDKKLPEKAVETESEQPIADHMQDDYWADILINVEEPLSSLKRKDESKKRTSKKAHRVKKLWNNSSLTLESVGKTSDNKKDMENGEQPKDESKPFAVNESQLNAETRSAEEIENRLLTGLVLHFSRPSAVPSRSDLIKIFSQYGPVKEAKAEIANNANSAQVIFKRRMDAEAAFAGAGKISALGPALDSFRLTDFPAAASGNEPSHGASKTE